MSMKNDRDLYWFEYNNGTILLLTEMNFYFCLIYCFVKVWYPLGRPVGTTIYPGMQFTAVYLKRYIFGDSMSLNDVCCYIPAWFGCIATILVGCIAYEASLPQNSGGTIFGVVYDGLLGRYADDKSMMGGSRSRIFGLSSPAVECAVFAMGFMAVVPAHLMRSVGGGYDNESVAVTAMTLTFFLWMRSLRTGDKYSHFVGVLAGVAYFNMVAAWGGYVFVLNLIGAHAAFLVLLGRFSTKVYLAYTSFYVGKPAKISMKCALNFLVAISATFRL